MSTKRCLGRERETAPDRLTVEPAEYQRIIRRSGTAKRPYRAGGAVLEVANVRPLARLVCLRGANADPDPGAVGCSLYVAPRETRLRRQRQGALSGALLGGPGA